MNASAKQRRDEEEASVSVEPLLREKAVKEEEHDEEIEDEVEDEEEEEEWTDEEDEMPESSLTALLQKLPHEDAYKILLMAFQRYKADYEEDHEKALEGQTELKKHFRVFLEGMEEDELVPAWWDEQAKHECESLAEKFKWEPAGSQENVEQ
jgi:hypothetical protein